MPSAEPHLVLICLADTHMIITHRFRMRPLTVADVSERYLGWLSERRALLFISGATGDNQLEELKSYVYQRVDRKDILFLGIFTHDGEHIGNIKYEPIDVKRQVAIMGILVGEVAWRGKGVAGEVIHASAVWLRDNRNVHTLALGVDYGNIVAIRAYEKLGFLKEKHPLIPLDNDECCSMVLRF